MSMAGRNDAVPTTLLTTIARLGQVALGGSIAAAGLALGTAASGSGQIVQYYFVFQDAPILVLFGIFLSPRAVVPASKVGAAGSSLARRPGAARARVHDCGGGVAAA